MSYQKFWIILALFLITSLGIGLRYKNMYPANILFGFDQYEDLFYTRRIALDHKLLIMGRGIYGTPNTHHGVFTHYFYVIPYLLFNKDPFKIAVYNSIFNAGSAILLFLFLYSIFKKPLPGLIAAIISALSFKYIELAGWVAIPTNTLIFVPLYFGGLWMFYQKRGWGLILSALSLGLSIQSDLLFLYLIPTIFFYLLILRPKFPNVYTLLLSIFTFLLSISTMILTEIKMNFAGVYSLLNFPSTFDEGKKPFLDRFSLFLNDFGQNFSANLSPQNPELGIYLALIITILTLLLLFKGKFTLLEKKGLYLLLIYLFSPSLMLLLGYHNQPWTLIGLPPAIALITGFTISQIKPVFLIIPILLFVGWSNLDQVLNHPRGANVAFSIDSSSLLSSQLAVMDYLYQGSNYQPFAINSVTFPLYRNNVWAYDFDWYGQQKYGYLPGWLGGDQIYPYNLLPKSKSDEKYFYMIIDNTYNIPQIYKDQGRRWAEEHGKLIEEKEISGFIVQKREYLR